MNYLKYSLPSFLLFSSIAVRTDFFKGPYFNIYRQNIASSRKLQVVIMFPCWLFIILWESHKLHNFRGNSLDLPFRTRLRIPEEGDNLVFSSASWACVPPTTRQPYSIPLLNPRSFLQLHTTALDVCAVTIRVGKMLSMLWSSFVCPLSGAA